MGLQLPEDAGLFQWIIAGVATAGAGALVFVARSLGGRIEAVEARGNVRVDAADKRIDTFREEVRKEADAGDDRLWQAVNTNRAEAEARQREILTTMATKDDVRELGRRIEAAITRQAVP
ncbi:MAG: hypothetical protein JWO51_131 [Rhodospirillales bacterium]|nr:hypothetical protein [Rhodospirillales bacterium]